MKINRALRIGALCGCVSLLGLGAVFELKKWINLAQKPTHRAFLTKEKVAEAVEKSASSYQFPDEIDVNVEDNQKVRIKVEYSFDQRLQKSMQKLFETYSPDFGAFVAMDASTGRVLSMVSYSRSKEILGNLALRASFPSASVFKVVTATAAIEEHKVSPNTIISFNGRNHTLYRGQILQSNVTRWTRFITLREAFARSINTVFGKIGAFTVGSDGLRLYADRFGFNRKIFADLPIQEGKALIPNDSWGLAESASGYTRDNTMSPVQGALIAASVANDGVMMEPYMIQSMVGSDGTFLYLAEPKVSNVTMDPSTAGQVRNLMKETVLHGTSKTAFRGFFKKDFSLLDVGGKTGSLTGNDPHGKYDWFVGFAGSGSHRIALAALTIHQKQWRVKSSYLARLAIENYFRNSLHINKTVAQSQK